MESSSNAVELHQDVAGSGKTNEIKGSDKVFFSSYAHVNIHENMVRDEARTQGYRQAIMQCSDLIKGKVVVDIGCGTGILSCFCAKAGARKVYGIDASSIIEQAKQVVRENNLESVVELINGKAEVVDLPEKADILVSEWMGNFLFFEGMLNSVVVARDRFLKKGGLILPGKCTLFVSPVDCRKLYERRIDFWSSTKKTYDLSMECMIPFAKKCLLGSVRREDIPSESVIGPAQPLYDLDVNTVTLKGLDLVKGDFQVTCDRSTSLTGFATWFDAYFEAPGKDTKVLSTSPFSTRTHWNQAVLYRDEGIPVKKGDVIQGSMTLTPADLNERHLDIKLSYQIGDGQREEKMYNTWQTPGPVEMY
ncbi:protein arginine N-methyltransferase 6-like [Acanthaster planci]|uniref:Protein arginine N-methyltransferase 6 n=1 Tax=Acanthaster planci TaxID=133434 RepID=A0A8B7ZUD6_ACAPL|nr:protein arginine N-methyltransferase 6-like [Acanthaster planci]XP_022109031.1 protein arginine N-methyltransferase 6-like [Acanthaster planci]XP_022109032.1 protein arginine N-methyltransferase 6-like [Acanthaster planci]XP_022109034.1 protein arginine N-methyltransferase 6-like [Acanthaster planci]